MDSHSEKMINLSESNRLDCEFDENDLGSSSKATEMGDMSFCMSNYLQEAMKVYL